MPLPLHETLAVRRDEVLARWKQRVQGDDLAPDSIPSLELVDHIPVFLDEIVEALRTDSGLSVALATPPTKTAAFHGAQRLRLGFSLDAVVGEYGCLRDAIVEVARDSGEPITFRELQVLFDCVVTGIAQAVSEYARQRDAELSRQANEHFAFIAHELRNPLSSAITALDILQRKGKLPSDDRTVGALQRGLRRTTELVDETLQIAKVASGIGMRRRASTLRALVDEATTEALPEAESKGVEIAVAIADDEPVDLDVRLVSSALGNLVRNAVKYTSTGSKVSVRARISDERATVEVEDCCGGLPPGKVEQAFAPFVRLDNKQDGFGLGLAIAKQAVEAHGGSLRVQNLPGKGCIFVLEIPIRG